MRYKIPRAESYLAKSTSRLRLPLAKSLLDNQIIRKPDFKLPTDLTPDVSTSMALYRVGRLAGENYHSLAQYFTSTMGLFERAESSCLGVLPKRGSRALEHRMSVQREGEFLAVDESGRWPEARLLPVMERALTARKPMFFVPGLDIKMVFDNLDMHNLKCEVFPLERLWRKSGDVAVVPFYYRDPVDPQGVLLMGGDLRCKGTTMDGYWRAYWSASVVMEAAAQISVLLTHKFDTITILTKIADFTADFREAIMKVIEKKARGTYLLLIDLDDFKRVNDEHGYQAGNEVLAKVADRIRASVGAGDIVSRWGGEEFAVIIRDIDNKFKVLDVAQRIRRNVSRRQIKAPDGSMVRVTCSIGVAPVDHAVDELLLAKEDMIASVLVENVSDRVFDVANAHLKKAKSEGKNRVGFPGPYFGNIRLDEE